MAAKSYEFEAWVREVKRIPSFAGGKRETDELFSTFCEEWNTCTLPEKYYNIMAWELAQRGGGGAGGGAGGGRGGGFSAARDEEGRRAELEAAGLQKAKERMELLRAAALAKGADPEVKKREELQLAAAYAFKKGDTKEQQRLQKKMEEMDKDAAAAKWKGR
jgi:hypothetical protein